MKDHSKVQLSAFEMKLVTNTEWILTKNDILQKVKLLLEQLQNEQEDFLHAYPGILPAEVMTVPGKVSKGENYKGLPYLVLDYPRFFGKDDHFAIRSMFWWGNFFSQTLHLSGTYKTNHEHKIESSFSFLKEQSFFICISDEQWEHHFEVNNYLPVSEMSDKEFRSCIRSKDFIKIAQRFPLEEWDNAADILLDSFRKTIQWLDS